MPIPESVFTVHPDVVTQAIKGLCWVIGIVGTSATVIGGGLIKVLLYIWGKADSRMTSVESKLDKIADSVENVDKTTAIEISGIKLRCALIHANSPFAQVRASDLPKANEEAKP